MSFPKLLGIFATVLFSIILLAGLFKHLQSKPKNVSIPPKEIAVEMAKEQEVRTIVLPPEKQAPVKNVPVSTAPKIKEVELPHADRIEELFTTKGGHSPLVQTISYKSQTSWQKGRPAWLSDYASHYSTSRHFIARSLNGNRDYFKQDIAEGDSFNVWNPEKKISFYLLIDASRCKMWFYAQDLTSHERILLKTYPVGLGRINGAKASGMLTPFGKYSLGNKIAIYKPKVSGMHNGKKIEMIKVFGTRWIPFEKEIAGCTAPAAGFGIHGVPWIPNEKGELVPNDESLGKYDSDGCIRLKTDDMEELYSIVISFPTIVEIVKDFTMVKSN